jgi:hypothetical protein
MYNASAVKNITPQSPQFVFPKKNSAKKDLQAYYSASVVVVNAVIVGLAPQFVKLFDLNVNKVLEIISGQHFSLPSLLS